jgi:hypothetical protein
VEPDQPLERRAHDGGDVALLALHLRAFEAVDVGPLLGDPVALGQQAEQVDHPARAFFAKGARGIAPGVGLLGGFERAADRAQKGAANFALKAQARVTVEEIGELARPAARHAAQHDEGFQRAR